MEHEGEVSLLTMPSNNVLITYALDKYVRVWALNESTATLFSKFKVAQPLIALDYCKKNEVIAMMLKDCSIGCVKLSLEGIIAVEDIVAVEDIDLEDIDMADLADHL